MTHRRNLIAYDIFFGRKKNDSSSFWKETGVFWRGINGNVATALPHSLLNKNSIETTRIIVEPITSSSGFFFFKRPRFAALRSCWLYLVLLGFLSCFLLQLNRVSTLLPLSLRLYLVLLGFLSCFLLQLNRVSMFLLLSLRLYLCFYYWPIFNC